MRSKLNPLTYIALAVLLIGLIWLLFCWQPSAAQEPVPDPIWPNVNIPEVRNGR